ncbi:MAG: alginate lyase family protein [Pseudodesulfovibrio sp.]|uniref:alginate lyase family protein n=1 Tax=Pseudodesulfovibrio TaxID=2035811 RepID=UPI00059E7B00|nr:MULTISPECIES: alginate lyase family protein [Pseudodesulfovibrio]MBV1773894.1 alginate lyase family protein [Pseudodesulfovibrio sp.]MCG2732558.1 alginate lyase family protein [Pseudodesulfovibrio aespoeensis]
MAGRSRAPCARLAGLLRLTAFLAAFLAALLAPWPAPVASLAGEPPTIVFSPEVLARTRAQVLAGDPALMPALSALIRDADAAMAAQAQAVVLKPGPPPGGDLHDFWSLAPDAAQDSDPCADTYDRLRLRRMARDSLTLAQAWHLTGNADYAGKGTALLWAWCCDSLTRARPAMTYAHARPADITGNHIGSHTGIIEARDLIDAVEAACLLADSPAWSRAVDRAVKGWFGEFLRWLRGSEFGRQAAADQGCLGLWRDAQVAAFALFVGDGALARDTVEGSCQRMAAMTISGRPAPSGFALRAMLTLAAVGERAGVNIWGHDSLGRAMEGVRPDSPCSHAPDCADRLVPPDLTPLLLRAAMALQGPRYGELVEELPQDSRARLFH